MLLLVVVVVVVVVVALVVVAVVVVVECPDLHGATALAVYFVGSFGRML
jgi:hypothetical protein